MSNWKDHRIQKAKAREEALRRRKAATAAQPRGWRADLQGRLSPELPLVGYFVNANWAEARMANVYVIRRLEDREVFAGFLVDTAWWGTKDVFGRSGPPGLLDEIRAHDHGIDLVPLDRATAVNLIRGGVAWAERFGYPLPADRDLWLRLVDPAPARGPDLRVFGDKGKRPFIIGTLEEVTEFEGPLLLDPEPPPARVGLLARLLGRG